MPDIAFLHVIRSHELNVIKRHLFPGARILEIGGGTGFQAKLLAEGGFDVVSIDVPQSNYALERVFPVIDYDGRNIPFADRSFDIVLSSNVLEHVEDLPALHRDIKRIMRPDGYCVHVMPSGSWRFWSNVTHYIDLIKRICQVAPRLFPRSWRPAAVAGEPLQGSAETAKSAAQLALLGLRALFPPRHGDRGNAITEIHYFGRKWWCKHFIENGYEVVDVHSVGLFYTGYTVLGSRLAIRMRERMARRMGGASNLFKVRPVGG